ncbi:NAD(P)/FAD-dependent oxidoreductase [Acidobacteriota bacterium]
MSPSKKPKKAKPAKPNKAKRAKPKQAKAKLTKAKPAKAKKSPVTQAGPKRAPVEKAEVKKDARPVTATPSYDVIIIGAGSVGLPIAYFLTKRKTNVLVIDQHPASGQGQNKAAIGGVRATHSDPAKILLCKESLKIFRALEDEEGCDVGFKEGGYCFPVYTESIEKTLKGILPIQKSFGLEIDWVGPEAIKEVIPGIREEGLRGGTVSPKDAQVSPLQAAVVFERLSAMRGATFKFNEKITGIEIKNGTFKAVKTSEGRYRADKLVIAAGAEAREVGQLMGIDIPVTPDSHEAGITAPVAPCLDPLVVDLRPGPEGKTANFYFGQNKEGQIIFCYTPSELFVGTNRESLSEFMPIVARRLIDLIPRFRNLLVRRVWRGLYPMTPDGVPVIDKHEEIDGLYLAVGMCGQGFMLGPGVGLNMASLVLDGNMLIAPEVAEPLKFNRDFYAARKEALK